MYVCVSPFTVCVYVCFTFQCVLCLSMYVLAYRDLLASQGLSLVSDITGIPLNDSVDATCAKYEYTGMY